MQPIAISQTNIEPNLGGNGGGNGQEHEEQTGGESHRDAFGRVVLRHLQEEEKGQVGEQGQAKERACEGFGRGLVHAGEGRVELVEE